MPEDWKNNYTLIHVTFDVRGLIKDKMREVNKNIKETKNKLRGDNQTIKHVFEENQKLLEENRQLRERLRALEDKMS